jgi:hypothetical protein
MTKREGNMGIRYILIDQTVVDGHPNVSCYVFRHGLVLHIYDATFAANKPRAARQLERMLRLFSASLRRSVNG